jgi:hypothetical protein
MITFLQASLKNIGDLNIKEKEGEYFFCGFPDFNFIQQLTIILMIWNEKK